MVGVTFSAASSQWINSITGPAQGLPATDQNFDKFPEVLQYRLKRLLIMPLRAQEHLLGLLTLGRSTEEAYATALVRTAERADRLLTALLERIRSRRSFSSAKWWSARRILQRRRQLSEEQAYLLLRNNSRRRRVSMLNLAREIFDLHHRAEAAARCQTA